MKRIFFENFVPLVLITYILLFLLRLLEVFLIVYNYGFDESIFFDELIGIGWDLLLFNAFLVLYFPIYYFVSKISSHLVNVLTYILFFVIVNAGLLVLTYFIYQRSLLDIFIFKYSFQEIIFTIKTSTAPITLYIIILLGFIILLAFLIKCLLRVTFSVIVRRIILYVIFLSIPLLVFFFPKRVSLSNYSINKLYYFIEKTYDYLLNKENIIDDKFSDQFQHMLYNKAFFSDEYPMVYHTDRNDELGSFFYKFNETPNIVILIIEGLNDDFIRKYMGVELMPFLSGIKEKSLYWSRCFTLGERSFAAVPSILGGLPYGEKGFLFLDRLPRHLSMVSVLKSNGYFTSFYYGQGAWFHKKDRFFSYNDIDLIIDNAKFSDSYEKIIVGNDKFFWGYNDKDLFNQFFEISDTLKSNKKLDIFFTGTSHSPFAINNADYYSKRLEVITKQSNPEFFKANSKYFQSILFVDDAIRDFFTKYERKADYVNTIFIITGDHPMTEVPIVNSLKRYHVPLIIYSKNLRFPMTFKHTVSHLDISETILNFLQQYKCRIPNFSTSLGYSLISNRDSIKSVAFMNDNRQIVDLFFNDHYLADGILYNVDSSLNIVRVDNDSIKSDLKFRLDVFKQTNLYVSNGNKLISSSMYCDALNFRNIYSFQKNNCVKVSEEYFNFTDQIEIPNIHLTFDISFKHSTNSLNDVSIVYQVTNKRDSVLLWESLGLNKNSNITQEHIKIQQFPIRDSILFFKAFIWNKNKIKLNISDIDFLLYESK